MEKVIVEFTGAWRGYGKGEVAGFDAEVAKSLIDGGRAQAYEVKKASKSAGKGKAGPSKDAPQSGPSSEPPPVLDPGAGDAEDDEDKP